ncbi:MAG TPA: methyltransferase domain-containing protein [Pyrinomonadaceae bacterium]|jgi:SAM-dependent methyltransferase
MADWDERYGRGEYATLEPNPLLVRFCAEFAPARDGAQPGADAPRRALDLACGAGRHALYLAARGWQVTAVDASRVGVELTAARARERGLVLDARVADLERGEFPIAPDAYDLICDLYYLQRDLFPAIRAGLCPGGALVAAIHIRDETAEPHGNPDFLLRPGELRALFADWHVAHYHETPAQDPDAGQHHHRTAELIAFRK